MKVINTLQDNIKELCKINGITVSQLEQTLGISRNSIYQWSKGNPSIDKIIKIADYFNISIDNLLGRHIPEASASTYNLQTILKDSVVSVGSRILTTEEKDALLVLLHE